MNKYELVVVLDSNLSSDKQKKLISDVEKMFGKSILDTDNMGLLDLASPIDGLGKAYFISYCLDIDGTSIEGHKTNLSLTKGVVRFSFYKMGKNEKFLKFAEVNKQFEVTVEEKTKKRNENAFLSLDSEVKAKRK